MRKFLTLTAVIALSYSLPIEAAQDPIETESASAPSFVERLQSFTEMKGVEMAAMCLAAGEELSGASKTCFYNCPTGTKAVTVSAGQLCPLSIDG